MSASARRVSSTVALDRFDWQRRGEADAPATPPVAPLFARATPGRTPELRELLLPSAAAERIAAVERDAFGEGYAEGLRTGESTAAARLDAMTGRLMAAIEELGSLRAGMMRRTERELVRLAVAMAERIVRREVDVDTELLATMARKALDRLGERVAATIHLNPADHDRAVASGSLTRAGGAVEIVADAQVPRGGCVVRSASGVIDAGIDAQIREISRALLADHGEEAAPHGDAPDA